MRAGAIENGRECSAKNPSNIASWLAILSTIDTRGRDTGGRGAICRTLHRAGFNPYMVSHYGLDQLLAVKLLSTEAFDWCKVVVILDGNQSSAAIPDVGTTPAAIGNTSLIQFPNGIPHTFLPLTRRSIIDLLPICSNNSVQYCY